MWNKLWKILDRKNSIHQFLVLVSFLLTFLVVRTITHLQKAHLLPNQNGPVHIHHMTLGIILLLITGYISISFQQYRKLQYYIAIIFGIGAALTLDEFALWLFLQNVYWAKQGRDSIDAVIIAIVLISLSLLFTDFPVKKFFKKGKKNK